MRNGFRTTAAPGRERGGYTRYRAKQIMPAVNTTIVQGTTAMLPTKDSREMRPNMYADMGVIPIWLAIETAAEENRRLRAELIIVLKRLFCFTSLWEIRKLKWLAI